MAVFDFTVSKENSASARITWGCMSLKQKTSFLVFRQRIGLNSWLKCRKQQAKESTTSGCTWHPCLVVAGISFLWNVSATDILQPEYLRLHSKKGQVYYFWTKTQINLLNEFLLSLLLCGTILQALIVTSVPMEHPATQQGVLPL